MKRTHYPAKASKPRFDPAPHQQQALNKMEQWYSQVQQWGGVLVLPTGGGKTFVATRFICHHPLSDGYRILWLAHTHHLLEQAKESFSSNISLVKVKNTNEQVHVMMVSGATGHSKAGHMGGSENILLCSLQTATRAFKDKHPKFTDFVMPKKGDKGLFVVFDEAHHAPAPTYRKLLMGIQREYQKHKKSFGLLGLTATPIHSNKRQQGYLKKLFPQGIIAEEDPKNLIARGVLARPILEDVHTTIKPKFNKQDYQKWVRTHRDIPQDVIKNLADNQPRNDSIVSHYVANKAKYDKTIIFADRWYQCEYLVEALTKRGVSAGAVYSRTESSGGDADYRNRRKMGDNAQTIKDFKDGKLQVLVNIRMLTEGTDVPNAKTVFLTRQTTSEILLKQMIGRALRGPKFGGTKDAYIVSFIDNWQQHIDWATYDHLMEGLADDISPMDVPRPPMELISIDLIRHLARRMDKGITNILPYKKLLPIGWYLIEYETTVGGTNNDTGSVEDDDIETVRGLIMVYEDDRQPLEEFISKLQELSWNGELQDFEYQDLKMSETLDKKLEDWRREVFGDGENRSHTEMTENLLGLARHVAQREVRPHFIKFGKRDDHNMDEIAQSYIDHNLGPIEINNRLKKEYGRQDLLWQRFYPEYNQFKSEYNTCSDRILNPKEDPPPDTDRSSDDVAPEPTEPSEDTKKQVRIRDSCVCLCCASTKQLHIDHIKPKYFDMDHSLANLQLLCRICNEWKSNKKTINFRKYKTPLNERPDTFPDVGMPKGEDAKHIWQWKNYLRRNVNFFYECSAVQSIRPRRGRPYIWDIWLRQDNEPDWLRFHVPEIIKRIQEADERVGLVKLPKEIRVYPESDNENAPE